MSAFNIIVSVSDWYEHNGFFGCFKEPKTSFDNLHLFERVQIFTNTQGFSEIISDDTSLIILEVI